MPTQRPQLVRKAVAVPARVVAQGDDGVEFPEGEFLDGLEGLAEMSTPAEEASKASPPSAPANPSASRLRQALPVRGNRLFRLDRLSSVA